MEESIEDEIKILDRVNILLTEKRFFKFYSVDELMDKIPSLYIFRKKNVESYLNSTFIGGKNNIFDFRILNAVYYYRLKKAYLKNQKAFREIFLKSKSKEEQQEIKKKEYEFTKLVRDVFFLKDPRWWFGFSIGFIIPTSKLIYEYFYC